MARRRNLVLVMMAVLWLLSINAQAQIGTVLDHQKISDTEGNFTGVLNNSDYFGVALASLGDLDGDNVNDIAVGAHYDDDGGLNRGAVWILFLNSAGTVKNHQKISDTQGNFTGVLDIGDSFGVSIANLGDMDGDNVNDIAVGAYYDGDGGTIRGAVWILFLNIDGTVKSHQKISDTQGNFSGIIDNMDHFGQSVTCIGDLDGDSVTDIAVGTYGDDDGGTNRGAVWILFLNSDGTVKSHQKISSTQGGFTGSLDNGDLLGVAVTSWGDVNGDGIVEIAVGAHQDDDGGTYRGAVWILFLEGLPALVEIDIKPRSCPNPLNVKSKGVLSVAILGSEDFDVYTIDPASIFLNGVPTIRSSLEDVATPLSDANECECSTEGPDGYLDLTLKFETQKIVEAIGEVDHGDELVLELTGVLSDETLIEGSDCVIIRGKHKPINRADFNGDGIVDMADFAAFAENWLQLSIVEY
jgi:hypothetical protein